jgi:uncharacterized protein
MLGHWIASARKSRAALVDTSYDGVAPGNDSLAAALRAVEDSLVATLQLPTDHSYSDQRTALSSAVLQSLAGLLRINLHHSALADVEA